MKKIPYGRHRIEEDDIKAVVQVLNSDWLTTGPLIGEFEQAFAKEAGSQYAVAVSSGTAALHAAMNALDIGPGDEVIVPPMTFAATANAVVYQGGKPVFCDVSAKDLLINPRLVEKQITPKTRCILSVDYAGAPCDYETLRKIASSHGLAFVSDACHALGAKYGGKAIGSLADMTIFSFHPVKHITTGEGGMIATDSKELYEKMRRFRNHGISTDLKERTEKGLWHYEMVDLGFNYRITDFQCALGISQLKKLNRWLEKRQTIAEQYSHFFQNRKDWIPLEKSPGNSHAWHLYVVRVPACFRDEIFKRFRAKGILANVHYIPVHLHPFYRKKFGTGEGLCPVAEEAYERILSLPIYPGMGEDEVIQVLDAAKSISEELGLK